MKLDCRRLAEITAEMCAKASAEEQAKVIDAALELLSKHGMSRAMRTFTAMVMDSWCRQENVVPVTLTTPTGEMGEAQRHQFMHTLESLLRKKIDVREEADASLMGGIRIAYGDERLDLSIRSALNRLSSHLQV